MHGFRAPAAEEAANKSSVDDVRPKPGDLTVVLRTIAGLLARFPPVCSKPPCLGRERAEEGRAELDE